MDDIIFRELRPEETGTLISMRIGQLREEGAEETCDLRPRLRSYYEKHMADGSFCCIVAERAEEIVATGAISVIERPPHYGNPEGKAAILSSMYTLPDYRRLGIARRILGELVEEARRRGCGEVQITASPTGALLYADFGFRRNGNYMAYRL